MYINLFFYFLLSNSFIFIIFSIFFCFFLLLIKNFNIIKFVNIHIYICFKRQKKIDNKKMQWSDRYELMRGYGNHSITVGFGSYGQVKMGIDKKTKKNVAIKIVKTYINKNR